MCKTLTRISLLGKVAITFSSIKTWGWLMQRLADNNSDKMGISSFNAGLWALCRG